MLFIFALYIFCSCFAIYYYYYYLLLLVAMGAPLRIRNLMNTYIVYILINIHIYTFIPKNYCLSYSPPTLVDVYMSLHTHTLTHMHKYASSLFPTLLLYHFYFVFMLYIWLRKICTNGRAFFCLWKFISS